MASALLSQLPPSRVAHRRASRVPVLPRVGKRLVGSGFILRPHREVVPTVGGLNQAFFRRGIRIGNGPRPARAPAPDDAGGAPGPILLPSESGVVQYPPNDVRGDLGKPSGAVRGARCSVVSDAAWVVVIGARPR